MNRPTAARAQTIVQAILDELGPEHAAYWVMPNTVLTLAGARGLCDGVFYHPQPSVREQWQTELAACRPVLERQLDLMFFEVSQGVSPTFQEPYTYYDLLHGDGLGFSLERTTLIPTTRKPRLLKLEVKAISDALAAELKTTPKFKTYKQEDLHHIAAGILLGYPDAAIVGYLEAEAKEAPTLPARIKHAAYYDCPQPVYDYPKALATDPAIQRHEKLWSGILDDFYTSDFHQKLAKNPAFHKRLRAIIKY